MRKARVIRPGLSHVHPLYVVFLGACLGGLVACSTSSAPDGEGAAGTSATSVSTRAPSTSGRRSPVTPRDVPGVVPTPVPKLVASARWVSRDGVRALKVSPTKELRSHPLTAWAEAAWPQVLAEVPAADSAGMSDQFRCHVQFASGKDAWFLEPSRPDVGYTATVLAGCNPGDVKDVG